MALLDNEKWMISQIHHAFITSDDTSYCEKIFLPHHTQTVEYRRDGDEERFDDDTDYSDSSFHVGSLDISPHMGHHRPRSDTMIKLEKLREQRKEQARCKQITWKEGRSAVSDEELNNLFKEKEIKAVDHGKKSLLTLLLESEPKLPPNYFNNYMKFDGKSQVGGGGSKTIRIWFSFHQDNFPMVVHCLKQATVRELIGLTCWQYTNEGRKPKLKSNINCYALHIAEDTGEVDTDFPPLEEKENIAKFGFPNLALVQLAQPRSPIRSILVTVHIPYSRYSAEFTKIEVADTGVVMREIFDKAVRKRKRRKNMKKGPRYVLEKLETPGVALDLDKTLGELAGEVREFCLVREHSARVWEGGLDSSSVSPVGGGEESGDDDDHVTQYTQTLTEYESFNVIRVHKYTLNSRIQIGISERKIEISPTPLPSPSPFFPKVSKERATTINMSEILSCRLTDDKSASRASLRLVYHQKQGNKEKYYQLETDITQARRIVAKLNHLLNLRSRRWT